MLPSTNLVFTKLPQLLARACFGQVDNNSFYNKQISGSSNRSNYHLFVYIIESIARNGYWNFAISRYRLLLSCRVSDIP